MDVTGGNGMTSQEVLQKAYRNLATILHDQEVKIIDLKTTGDDPSAAIKAMLSIAPNLTGAGAAAGAAAGFQQAQQQAQV